MEKAELYEIVENMSAQLGADVLLENMAMAMNYDELKANLEGILWQFLSLKVCNGGTPIHWGM